MQPKSLFIVDDSQAQAKYAQSLCLKLLPELHIESAQNGADALAALRTRSFDIALIDLEMPVMDGVELLAYVADERLVSAIVVLSSRESSLIASVGVMAEAQGVHVLGAIQKPITMEALEHAMGKFSQSPTFRHSSSVTDIQIDAAELEVAIREQQLSLHFQPKLTTAGLLLKGVEALARWTHPTLGNIPPCNFIAVAEKADLIDALTLYLFERALQYKEGWQKHGLVFDLAFNLSPLSLKNAELVEQLSQLVQKYHVATETVILEVTENVLLGDVGRALQILARLRLKGFRIALDDYGTGFSNTEQLARIPATELKLDRSMVNGIAEKAQLAKILESTVQLAQDLKLNTVAEGIETMEDYKLLRALGVDQVQGYLFSRPLAADKLKDWLAGLNDLRKKVLREIEN